MNSDCILFADDTALIKSHKNVIQATLDFQEDILRLTDWFHANQLSLYITKINFMVLSSNAKPSLHIDEIEITQVNNTKFLGVHLDSSLKWNIHMSTLINSLVSNRYMLHLTRNYMPEKVKWLVYCAHILSCINYAHILWGLMCSQWA